MVSVFGVGPNDAVTSPKGRVFLGFRWQEAQIAARMAREARMLVMKKAWKVMGWISGDEGNSLPII
ncbi:hypothetical protein MA16_Dca009260 [Dendrobium catenatum]|uniref:Uncharacterized protein n=1 Tax=Dendrobium catenatum TaxID=906689 RepID=A0A2I0WYW5_9ASPA|nr:hypothetical protein MA16_Dca009260 [Dendrobium catenatum]